MGFPGAPGCTTTGAGVALLCRAKSGDAQIADAAIAAIRRILDGRRVQNGGRSSELGIFNVPNYHELTRRKAKIYDSVNAAES